LYRHVPTTKLSPETIMETGRIDEAKLGRQGAQPAGYLSRDLPHRRALEVYQQTGQQDNPQRLGE